MALTRPILLAILLAGCSAQYAGNATPRAAPDSPAHSGAPLRSVSPAERDALLAHRLDFGSGAPPLTPEVLAGGTTYSGRLAWADPKYGPRYLALREPRGTLVELCAASGCVQRRSTDFGPVRSLWLAGRIADVSAADFLEICGVPLSFGLCPGSVQVLKRPRFELPATSTKEGP